VWGFGGQHRVIVQVQTLVVKAHRLLYHSALCLRVIKKKKKDQGLRFRV